MFKDPKTVRTILKVTTAVVTMFAYGAIHKAEKKISEKISENYPDPVTEPENQELPTAN